MDETTPTYWVRRDGERKSLTMARATQHEATEDAKQWAAHYDEPMHVIRDWELASRVATVYPDGTVEPAAPIRA